MELKDKLKQLRKDKGLSQAQLAQMLFVSRSTVAKWENGLGLPAPESMERLEQEFAITREEISTSEPESVIVEKNRRLRRFGEAVAVFGVIIIMVLLCILPFWVKETGYGPTVEIAARSWADNEYLDTGDYRIYYYGWDCGEEHPDYIMLAGVQPIKRHFWGCTREDYKSYRVFNGDKRVAILHTIKGENGYYNFFERTQTVNLSEVLATGEFVTQIDKLADNEDERHIFMERVYVNGIGGEYGEECEVQKGFFFVSSEPVESITIEDVYLDVDTMFVGDSLCY